ncbi:MAG: ATP-binding protein [Actinomycetota bacterium]|nr:ATP-binding protein [Actinomycetota bacterium]MDQ3573590.1 ATP-binding protein [Actinomycetota bacterium]
MATQLVLQLELPADARLLPRTRRAVAGYLEDVGAEPDDRADVVLALDEACANVIRHAFPDGAPGTIRLRAEIGDGAVTVQVEDDGVGFDAFEVTRSEPAPEDTSGRGLHMIRTLMTTVQLESPTETGGTRLRMQKRLGDSARTNADG